VLRIGFFPKFKIEDSVLLSAATEGVHVLLDAIAKAAANPDKAVPLHELARVSTKHPVSLYVAANAKAVRSVPANAYYLNVSGNARFNLAGLLEPLLEATRGHQFFDLNPKPTVLVVSVGEYDGAWWDRVEKL
jgi:hypothetical protein